MLVDEGAGALTSIDRPFVLEPAQRVTDSGAADPEFAGEIGLGGDPAILEMLLGNGLFDVLAHLFGEGGASADHRSTPLGFLVKSSGRMVV